MEAWVHLCRSMDPLRRGVIAKHELLQVLTFMGLRCSAHPIRCTAMRPRCSPSQAEPSRAEPSRAERWQRLPLPADARVRLSAEESEILGNSFPSGRAQGGQVRASARPSSDGARLRVRRVAPQHCRCAACEPQALHRPLRGAQVDYGAFTASLLRRLSPRVTALIKSTWARFEVVIRLLASPALGLFDPVGSSSHSGPSVIAQRWFSAALHLCCVLVAAG